MNLEIKLKKIGKKRNFSYKIVICKAKVIVDTIGIFTPFFLDKILVSYTLVKIDKIKLFKWLALGALIKSTKLKKLLYSS